MKADDLLRKLEPLMPEEVARWQRNLDLADSELRDLLGRQIALVAHRLLGDPRQLLLSLPPQRAAGGAIGLGTVRYEAPKWPAGLSEVEMLQNLAIFGRSGAGKTNVCFYLLEQLAELKIPFVFLDWKRTARHLIPRLKGRVGVYTPGRSLAPFPFNPFLPPPDLEPQVYANFVVDAMCDAFTLGDGARSLLQTALLDEFNEDKTPTANSAAARIAKMPDRERVRGWKTSALRALETVARMTRDVPANTSQQETVQRLLTQSTILELDGLSPSNKQFLLPLVALWIYYSKLASPDREKLRLVLIVEEAHHVLYSHRNSTESVMEMLLRQCREIGIAVVVIDQHPHLMSSAALGNTYTSICLNLKDPKDIAKAAALSLVPREDAEHFSLLPVGRGIVKLQDRWRRPFVVDFPLVPARKGEVTDERLKAYLEGKETLSDRTARQPSANEVLRRSRVPDEELCVDAVSLLDDVRAHPGDGVDGRYRRLGWSADKGHRLVAKLCALDLLEHQLMPVGRTRRRVLRLSARAEGDGENAGGSGENKGRPLRARESIAHEYWKRWHAQDLESRGYEVTIEAERKKGRVDVLATRGSETIAVEVETGNSDAVDNVRQDLLSGFSRVLVVATTDKAWVKVMRELDRAGMLLPAVDLVVQGGGRSPGPKRVQRRQASAPVEVGD